MTAHDIIVEHVTIVVNNWVDTIGPGGPVRVVAEHTRIASRRQGKAQIDFSVTLPPPDSDMVAQVFKDRRVLKALLDSGLLRRVGWGPAAWYEVVWP